MARQQSVNWEEHDNAICNHIVTNVYQRSGGALGGAESVESDNDHDRAVAR